MSRFFIEEVKRKCFMSGINGRVLTAVKYNCDGVSKWLVNASSDGFSDFHDSKEDIFDGFAEAWKPDGKQSEEFAGIFTETAVSEFCGFKFEDHDNQELINLLAETEEDEATALLMFIMHLSVCDDAEAKELIEIGLNKYSDEIYDIDCDFSQMTETQKYRFRLLLEADMKYETFLHVMYHEEFDVHRKTLKKLLKETDDAKYSLWKENFLADEFEKINKTDIIACPYEVEGFGKYLEIMHSAGLNGFMNFMLQEVGASIGEPHQAADDEIKTFIAINVNAEF